MSVSTLNVKVDVKDIAPIIEQMQQRIVTLETHLRSGGELMEQFIADGESRRWIPVEQRLPDHPNDVLGFIDGASSEPIHAVRYFSEINSGTWYFSGQWGVDDLLRG